MRKVFKQLRGLVVFETSLASGECFNEGFAAGMSYGQLTNAYKMPLTKGSNMARLQSQLKLEIKQISEGTFNEK